MSNEKAEINTKRRTRDGRRFFLCTITAIAHLARLGWNAAAASALAASGPILDKSAHDGRLLRGLWARAFQRRRRANNFEEEKEEEEKKK